MFRVHISIVMELLAKASPASSKYQKHRVSAGRHSPRRVRSEYTVSINHSQQAAPSSRLLASQTAGSFCASSSPAGYQWRPAQLDKPSSCALTLTLSLRRINGKLAIDGKSKLVNIKSRPALTPGLPPPGTGGYASVGTLERLTDRCSIFSPRLRRGVALRRTTSTGMATDPLAKPGAEIATTNCYAL